VDDPILVCNITDLFLVIFFLFCCDAQSETCCRNHGILSITCIFSPYLYAVYTLIQHTQRKTQHDFALDKKGNQDYFGQDQSQGWVVIYLYL
jgi:hypothetical protein